MILLNTTFAVDPALESAVTAFLKETYIPAALEAGMRAPLLTRMRMEPSMEAGQAVCLALQLRAPSLEVESNFVENVRPALYGKMSELWGMGVAMFDSALEVLHG